MGSAADMILSPKVSIYIGFFSGAVFVIGTHFLKRFFDKFLKLHDTCGVSFLHFIPGLLGGLIGSMISKITPEEIYGDELSGIYPMMGFGKIEYS